MKKQALDLFKKKKRLFIIQAVLTLMAISSLGVMTYSWIKRDWTPYVSGTNIKISTSDALVFIFDEGQKDTASIPDIVGRKDFVLRPVSNRNGKSGGFYNVSYDSSEIENAFYQALPTIGNATTIGADYGYIDFSFNINGPAGTCVFLNPRSLIECDNIQASQCIRVAITFNKQSTFIFRNQNRDKDNGWAYQYINKRGDVTTAYETGFEPYLSHCGLDKLGDISPANTNYWDPKTGLEDRTFVQDYDAEQTNLCLFSDKFGGKYSEDPNLVNKAYWSAEKEEYSNMYFTTAPLEWYQEDANGDYVYVNGIYRPKNAGEIADKYYFKRSNKWEALEGNNGFRLDENGRYVRTNNDQMVFSNGKRYTLSDTQGRVEENVNGWYVSVDKVYECSADGRVYVQDMDPKIKADKSFGMITSASSAPSIDIKIWLEGTDPLCTVDIKDSLMDLTVMFEAQMSEDFI